MPEMTWELYPRAREVILVRDFRDMVASMFAYNAKRGREGFHRDRFGRRRRSMWCDEIKGSVTRAGSRLGRTPRPRTSGPLRGPGPRSPRTRSPHCLRYLGLEAGASASAMAAALFAREPETEWHRTTPAPARLDRPLEGTTSARRPGRACERALAPELQAFGYTLEEAAV